MAGACVYDHDLRINHNCEGNARYEFTKEFHIVFFADRDIEKGQKVTHPYICTLGSTAPRRADILDECIFFYQCSGCVQNLPLSTISSRACLQFVEQECTTVFQKRVGDAM